MRIKPTFDEDEEFKLNRMLVKIIKPLLSPEEMEALEERLAYEKEQLKKSTEASSNHSAQK